MRRPNRRPCVTMRCDEPACDGTIWFAVDGNESRSGRVTGQCDGCGSTYSLFGGRVLRHPSARPAPTDGVGVNPSMHP